MSSGVIASHIGATHHRLTARMAFRSLAVFEIHFPELVQESDEDDNEKDGDEPDQEMPDRTSPARMIVNSLRNSAKGGAPVMATRPASHKPPSTG